ERRIALVTLPGPALYDASTRSQSPNILYRLDKYWHAASVAFKGSLLSSTYELTSRLYCFPVGYINCHKPVAPTLDFALGLSADSITARYFISIGTLYLAKCSSNIGK